MPGSGLPCTFVQVSYYSRPSFIIVNRTDGQQCTSFRIGGVQLHIEKIFPNSNDPFMSSTILSSTLLQVKLKGRCCYVGFTVLLRLCFLSIPEMKKSNYLMDMHAEPTSSSPPRLSGEFSSVALKRHQGSSLALTCLAQSFPAPLFR